MLVCQSVQNASRQHSICAGDNMELGANIWHRTDGASWKCCRVIFPWGTDTKDYTPQKSSRSIQHILSDKTTVGTATGCAWWNAWRKSFPSDPGHFIIAVFIAVIYGLHSSCTSSYITIEASEIIVQTFSSSSGRLCGAHWRALCHQFSTITYHLASACFVCEEKCLRRTKNMLLAKTLSICLIFYCVTHTT